jgi:glycosyltransferase involved in cell wall biosynthesis
MKILVVNRNYFITGGPEKYMFSLMENMPEHEFMPFCVNFDQNKATPYSRFFLEAPGGSGNVSFSNFQMSFLEKIRFSAEMVYSFKARKRLSAMIAETKPDIALFLNGVHFTDSIIDACREHGIPIIWRLSDFHKICANYLLFREGRICEECLERGLFSILRNHCGGYQRSLAVSLIKYAGMKLSRLRGIYNHIRYYIVPSQFTRKKMIQGGFPPERIVYIPTFVHFQENLGNAVNTNKDILYVGRISPEKGVETLIKAFERMEHRGNRLVIVGGRNSNYAKGLIASIPERTKTRVQFLGFRPRKEVMRLFSQCAMFIVPSIWYENQPNTVLEGMALGKPAIVSESGSLTELVKHGKTGYHFEAGNSDDLAAKMDMVLEAPETAIQMGLNALRYLKKHHSREKHLEQLNELFNKCVLT